MPLTRHNGDLGVKASPVNITVNNNAGVGVEIEETNSADGSKQIDIIIERKVKEAFGRGSMDKTMNSIYGMKRRGY